MLRSLAVSLVTVAGLLPGTVAAAAVTPLTLGKGDFPSVAVGGDGTAHVAWRGPSDGSNVSQLMFCRVPKGASACAGGARALPVPGTGESRPFVLPYERGIVVVQSRLSNDPAVRGLYVIISTDGGATFGTAYKAADVGLLLDAVGGPGSTVSAVGSYASNLRYVNFAFGIPETPFATLSSPGTGDLGAVALLNAATPFVLLYDGSGNAAWRHYDGSGDLNDEANWSAASTPGYLGEQPGLAHGTLGLFATGRLGPTSTRPAVRKFAGTGFAAPSTIDTTSANPVIAEDGGKRLHAVYGGFDLRHAVSDNGTAWRAETLVKAASPSGLPYLAGGPGHTGAVVYWSGGEVHLARLGTTTAAGTGKKTIAVAGGKVTLKGPRACVPPNESFVARVTYKRDGRLRKVTRVDFLVDGRRDARDRKAPFRESILQLNAPAGTTHSLKARVKIKVRGEEKLLTRTLRVKFQYCSS